MSAFMPRQGDILRFAAANGRIFADGGIRIRSGQRFGQGDPVRFDALGRITVGSIVLAPGLYAEGAPVTYADANGKITVGSVGSYIIFESDWNTAVGTSAAALRDTNQFVPWQTANNSNNILNVVATETALFGRFSPEVINLLRVNHLDNGVNGCYSGDVNIGTLPIPGIGQTYYYRMYFSVDIADDEGDWSAVLTSHHPYALSTGSTNPNQWEVEWAPNNAGGVLLRSAPIGATFPTNRWGPGKPFVLLNKQQAYCLHTALTRVAVNTYNLRNRLYGLQGIPKTETLYFDGDSKNAIPSYDGTFAGAAGFFDASSNLPQATTGNNLAIADSVMALLLMGTNGSNMRMLTRNTEYSFIGPVGIRTDDWWPARYIP